MDLSYWHTDRLIICAHFGAPSQKASSFNVSTHMVLMGMMSPLYVAFFPGKLVGLGQIIMPEANKKYTDLNSRTYLASKSV